MNLDFFHPSRSGSAAWAGQAWAVLAATQTVNRGCWAASSVLLAIIAAEEMPAGARAHALSLLASPTGPDGVMAAQRPPCDRIRRGP